MVGLQSAMYSSVEITAVMTSLVYLFVFNLALVASSLAGRQTGFLTRGPHYEILRLL